MPKPRSSAGKRDREIKKRERERAKREKAALKQQRRGRGDGAAQPPTPGVIEPLSTYERLASVLDAAASPPEKAATEPGEDARNQGLVA